MRGEEHLTKPQQYALVYSKGNSWVSNLVVMKALPNHLTLSRYGLSVSKRVGKAVMRNRVKRLFREILRIMPLKSGWDVIFIVRPVAATAGYARLKRAVEGLLSRARLLEADEEDDSLVEVKVGSGGEV
jgi:ribonuclease P protein component